MPNKANLWRPYTQEATAGPPVRVETAAGAYLHTAGGQEIVDGISSWWVITHGHCQPEIVEAVRRQAGRLEQVLFANFTHPAAEELGEELLEAAGPGFSKAFLSDNGSTAVEVALKMALQGWRQAGEAARDTFLTFSSAYHGDTAGAMSVSAAGSFTAPYEKMTFRTLRAAHPTHSAAPAEAWLPEFRSLLAENQERIAAVIVEPLVQGAGGMVMWPPAAVKEIVRLAHEAGTLVIFDEVMTGFGRTGSLFAYRALGLRPDFVCLSKGLTGGMLPLGATLTTQKIFDLFYSAEKARLFYHGHSFTGNALSCAAALANLKLIRADAGAFAGKLARIESFHRRRLAELAAEFPIGDPRVCGTIAAFELPGPDAGYESPGAARLVAHAVARGVFLRPLGNTLYLMPPYACGELELGLLWDGLASFLASPP